MKRGKSQVSSNEYKHLYRSREWKRIRLKLLMDCVGKCSACGLPKPRLDIDHIKPLHRMANPELHFFDLDNLQVLCVQCHIEKTRKENSAAWRENLTDAQKEWRAEMDRHGR